MSGGNFRNKVPKGKDLKRIESFSKSYYKGCVSKLGFPSKGQARAYARKHSNGKLMRPYKCLHCHRWHNTKKVGKILKDAQLAELIVKKFCLDNPDVLDALNSALVEGILTYELFRTTMPVSVFNKLRMIGADPEAIARESFTLFVLRSGTKERIGNA